MAPNLKSVEDNVAALNASITATDDKLASLTASLAAQFQETQAQIKANHDEFKQFRINEAEFRATTAKTQENVERMLAILLAATPGVGNVATPPQQQTPVNHEAAQPQIPINHEARHHENSDVSKATTPVEMALKKTDASMVFDKMPNQGTLSKDSACNLFDKMDETNPTNLQFTAEYFETEATKNSVGEEIETGACKIFDERSQSSIVSPVKQSQASGNDELYSTVEEVLEGDNLLGYAGEAMTKGVLVDQGLSENGAYKVFDGMTISVAMTKAEAGKLHSLKPESLQDTRHLFDEMPRRISAELNRDIYAIQSYIAQFGYVLQILDNWSFSLIDDRVTLSFDPGGYSLHHTDCGLLEIKKEHGDYCLDIWVHCPTTEQLYDYSRGRCLLYNVARSIEMTGILIVYELMLKWDVQAGCWRPFGDFLIRFGVHKAYFVISLFVLESIKPNICDIADANQAIEYCSCGMPEVESRLPLFYKSNKNVIHALNINFELSLTSSQMDCVAKFYSATPTFNFTEVGEIHMLVLTTIGSMEMIKRGLVAMVLPLLAAASDEIFPITTEHPIRSTQAKWKLSENNNLRISCHYHILRGHKNVVIVRATILDNFVWDPGLYAVFYILEDKDVFDREGKRIYNTKGHCIDDGDGHCIDDGDGPQLGRPKGWHLGLDVDSTSWEEFVIQIANKIS